MTVIGTVGLPGSGKSEAAAVARDAGIPVVIMGDVVRQACRERGLDPATRHGEMAKTLREENGPDAIARESLPRIEDHLEGADTVVVDGIRSDVEVERFHEAFGDEFVLVEVRAPERDAGTDEGGESMAARDERELGFGMGEAMEMADVTIDNDGSLAAFRSTVERLLSDGPEAIEDDE
ncbi:hypothetical protein BRD06_10390 [Halobacteriales archaeon QS_9_67_15]|nr:MAG: hypothetical protein BRD06_10390 [Halobacteriales archaeon QS_9_67_15]